jgi:hypothetical protein
VAPGRRTGGEEASDQIQAGRRHEAVGPGDGTRQAVRRLHSAAHSRGHPATSLRRYHHVQPKYEIRTESISSANMPKYL